MATESIIITLDTFDPTMVGQAQLLFEQFVYSQDNEEDPEPFPEAIAALISGFYIAKGNVVPEDNPDYSDGVNEYFPKG